MANNFSLLFTSKTLQKNYLYDDFIAGLTVTIVALPLSIAIAIASGATPEKGLITAVIGGLLVSMFGGSRFQIGGPTGAFIVVVYDIIATHGFEGLLLATFLGGLILIIFGIFRLGKVIDHIPHAVVTGFTTGIAIVIFTSQVKDFFGMQTDKIPSDFLSRWFFYFKNVHLIDFTATLVGFITIVIILIQRRFFKKLPGFLIAVILTSILIYFTQLTSDTIGTRYPNLKITFTAPVLPSLEVDSFIRIMPAAITVAFLAAVESLLCSVIADRLSNTKHSPNQELIGQGIANIASATLGGIPVTGALARTATNIKSGARSPWAGVVQSLLILCFILFSGKLVNYIPISCLSAILFFVSWNLLEVKSIVLSYDNSKIEFLVAFVTFLMTVFVSIMYAVAVGFMTYYLLNQMNKKTKKQ